MRALSLCALLAVLLSSRRPSSSSCSSRHICPTACTNGCSRRHRLVGMVAVTGGTALASRRVAGEAECTAVGATSAAWSPLVSADGGSGAPRPGREPQRRAPSMGQGAGADRRAAGGEGGQGGGPPEILARAPTPAFSGHAGGRRAGAGGGAANAPRAADDSPLGRPESDASLRPCTRLV